MGISTGPGVGVAEAVGEDVAVGVGDGDGLGVGVADGDGAAVGDTPGVGVGLGVGVGVGLAVDVGVEALGRGSRTSHSGPRVHRMDARQKRPARSRSAAVSLSRGVPVALTHVEPATRPDRAIAAVMIARLAAAIVDGDAEPARDLARRAEDLALDDDPPTLVGFRGTARGNGSRRRQDIAANVDDVGKTDPQDQLAEALVNASPSPGRACPAATDRQPRRRGRSRCPPRPSRMNAPPFCVSRPERRGEDPLERRGRWPPAARARPRANGWLAMLSGPSCWVPVGTLVRRLDSVSPDGSAVGVPVSRSLSGP